MIIIETWYLLSYYTQKCYSCVYFSKELHWLKFMKIQYIQISNVLSFKHYADFSECPKIMFDTQNRKDLHILVGPNGAGKSNLLEVMTQIFTKGVFRFFLRNENFTMKETISEASEGILPKLL